MFSRLYNYVYGQNQTSHIVHTEGRESRIKGLASNNAWRSKVQKELGFIVAAESKDRNPFYYLLHSLDTKNTKDLIDILFDQEEIKSLNESMGNFKKEYGEIYNLPNNDEIKRNFKILNDYYLYFDLPMSLQVENHFIEFFKACKLLADFVEHNNNNSNNVPYLHAYKMMVLFGAAHGQKQHILANVAKYLENDVISKYPHPVHDALVLPIPINNPPLKDLAGWQKFIAKYIPSGINYFQNAKAIENVLDKAPSTSKEAQIATCSMSYTNAKDYIELAELCTKYNIPENIFDKCLEINKARKTSDKLPQIQLDGKSVGYGRYHLVKLPITDPRAYLLGHITKCCQSIGGDSELCVIDGVKKETSGFYILLKGKSKATKPPLEKGEINYKDYDIVGQSYAWLSRRGNLTLDSWENLRPEQDDIIAVAMLREFAKNVAETHSDILRVTIGQGGKTPQLLSDEPAITNPEKTEEGTHQYDDSDKQTLLYFNKENMQKLIDTLRDDANRLSFPLACSVHNLQDLVSSLTIFGKHDFDDIKLALFSKNAHEFFQRESVDHKSNWELLSKTLNTIQSSEIKSRFLRLLIIILREDRMSSDSFGIITNLFQTTNTIFPQHLDCIESLLLAGMATKENINKFIICKDYYDEDGTNNPNLVSLTDLACGLQILLRNEMLCDYTFNLSLLYSKDNNLRTLIESLQMNKILTTESLELFINVSSEKIGQAIYGIIQINNEKISIKDYGMYVVSSSANPIYRARILKALSAKHLLGYADKIFSINDSDKEDYIATSLSYFNEDLLTPGIIDTLVEKARYLVNFNHILQYCKENEITLTTSQVFAFCKRFDNLGLMKLIVEYLYNTKILNHDSIEKLLANTDDDIEMINNTISSLYHIKQLSTETSNLVFSYPKQAYIMVVRMSYYTEAVFPQHTWCLSRDNLKLLSMYPENIGFLLTLMTKITSWPKPINKIFKLMLNEGAELTEMDVIELYSNPYTAYYLRIHKCLPQQLIEMQNKMVKTPIMFVKKLSDLIAIMNINYDNNDTDNRKKYISDNEIVDVKIWVELTHSADDFYKIISLLQDDLITPYITAFINSERSANLLSDLDNKIQFISINRKTDSVKKHFQIIYSALLNHSAFKEYIINIDNFIELLTAISNKYQMDLFFKNISKESVTAILDNFKEIKDNTKSEFESDHDNSFHRLDLHRSIIFGLEIKKLMDQLKTTVELIMGLATNKSLTLLNNLKLCTLNSQLLFNNKIFGIICQSNIRRHKTLSKKDREAIDTVNRNFARVLKITIRQDESTRSVIEEFKTSFTAINQRLSGQDIDDSLKTIIKQTLDSVIEQFGGLQEINSTDEMPSPLSNRDASFPQK